MNFGSSFDLGNLNGRNGFIINGFFSVDSLGQSISSAGDVNGDGITDLIIGNPTGVGPDGDSGFFTGESYVVFGGANVGRGGSFDVRSLNGRNGFAVFGTPGDLDRTGTSVSSAGDINRDGFDDLIIGSPGSGLGEPKLSLAVDAATFSMVH